MNDHTFKQLGICVDAMVHEIYAYEAFKAGADIGIPHLAMKHLTPLIEDLAAKLEYVEEDRVFLHKRRGELAIERDASKARLEIADTLHTQAADVLAEVRAEREELKVKLEAAEKERGVPIQVQPDGVWLVFEAPGANERGLVNLQHLIKESGPIVGKAISKWVDAARDREAAAQ